MPVGHFIEIPLSQHYSGKKKIPIGAAYFRVDVIGSAVTLYLSDTETQGFAVSEPGFALCAPDGDKFTEIFITNEQAGEGVLRLFYSDGIRVEDPKQASAGVESTRIAHLTFYDSDNTLSVRNMIDGLLSGGSDMGGIATGSGIARCAEESVGAEPQITTLDGLYVGTGAGFAIGGGRAWWANYALPLKRMLNSGAFDATFRTGLDTDYVGIEDDVWMKVYNGGGAGRAYAYFGAGLLHEDIGAMSGCAVGFYTDLTSGGLLEAIIYSAGAGGAGATFHKRTALTGYTAAEVHRLRVEIGRKSGSRFVRWLIDGQEVATFSPPVAVNVQQFANENHFAPFYSAFTSAVPHGALCVGLCGTGAVVDLVRAA